MYRRLLPPQSADYGSLAIIRYSPASWIAVTYRHRPNFSQDSVCTTTG
jgi:hypothetical protein